MNRELCVHLNENLPSMTDIFLKFVYNGISVILIGAVLLSVFKLLKALRKGSADEIKGQLLLTTLVVVIAIILFARRDWQFFLF